MMLAGEVDDRPDGDALRVAQIDEELCQPLVLLVRHDLRAEERDRVVGEMGVRRPYLGAVDEVAALGLRRARADGGQIGARIRLAHADGEGQLAANDPRQNALPLCLGSEAQKEWATLPVRNPVSADGRAGGEHLLHHHVALEEGALVAAVLLGPRHADPAARADAARELAVEATPRLGPLHGGGAAELLFEKLTHLGAETLGLGGQVVEREARSEEHTSELQSQSNLVCRLLLEKKKKKKNNNKRKN